VPDLFVSYVQEDGDIARDVASALEAAGYTVWYYERDSLPGYSYLEQILQVLDQIQAVVVIISSATLGSPQVNVEIAEAHTANKPFVPLLRDLTYATLNSRRRAWTMMFGTAVAAPIPEDGVGAVIPRLVRGLQALGIAPGEQTEAMGAVQTAPPTQLLTAPTPEATASPTRQIGSPSDSRLLLDIARVVAFPTDFGDRLPGLVPFDGAFESLDAFVARQAGSAGDARADELRQEAIDAGWRQHYGTALSKRDPEHSITLNWVFSDITEYASDDGARVEFHRLVPAGASGDIATVGHESAMALSDGVSSAGVRYQAATYWFRLGPLISVIYLRDNTNRRPDLAVLEMVARSVAARAEIVVNRGTVPLSALALRLYCPTSAGQFKQNDRYSLCAGTTLTYTHLFDRATRQQQITRLARLSDVYGVTDVFDATTRGTFAAGEFDLLAALQQPNLVENPPLGAQSPATAASASVAGSSDVGDMLESAGTEEFRLDCSLLAFPSENAAASYLRDTQQHVTENRLPTAVPDLGDGSIAVAFRKPLGIDEASAEGVRVTARCGAIVADLEIVGIPARPLAEVVNVMSLQLERLAAMRSRS
jgi:hypothetical protein